MPREAALEKYFRKAILAAGGMARKIAPYGERTWPDRLVLFPQGFMYFVELKKAGEVPTPAQARKHKKLREMGYTVVVLDSRDAVDEWIYHVLVEVIL